MSSETFAAIIEGTKIKSKINDLINESAIKNSLICTYLAAKQEIRAIKITIIVPLENGCKLNFIFKNKNEIILTIIRENAVANDAPTIPYSGIRSKFVKKVIKANMTMKTVL